MVVESQFLHKSVNSFFIFVIFKDKLTDLCGNRLLQSNFVKTFCEIKLGDCRHMNSVGFSDSKAIWLNDCDVAEPLSDRRLSVYEVVSQKSIPAQISQLILYIRYIQGQVDGFVRESTYAKRLYGHFL